jgi:hypothetical protein
MKAAFLFVPSLFVLSFLTFTATGRAQNAAAGAPGCGTADIKFDVKTDKSQHTAAQIETGKAVIYFVEDDTEFQAIPSPTTRIGLDGTWIGANHGSSYFFVSIDPGEHHLCASWQGAMKSNPAHQAAAHFTAEAGKAYYFSVKNTWLLHIMIPKMELTPLDSDQGQLLASQFAFSTSHPK